MLTGENAFSFHRENFFNKSGYTAVEEPTSRLFMDQGSKEQNNNCLTVVATSLSAEPHATRVEDSNEAEAGPKTSEQQKGMYSKRDIAQG